MTPTLIPPLLLLLYLSSFVFFALLRIFSGISIQRIGLSGFRRISFSPRDGVRIEIRALGLSVHRPTLTQRTWVSLKVSEMKMWVDLDRLAKRPADRPNQPAVCASTDRRGSLARPATHPESENHNSEVRPNLVWRGNAFHTTGPASGTGSERIEPTAPTMSASWRMAGESVNLARVPGMNPTAGVEAGLAQTAVEKESGSRPVKPETIVEGEPIGWANKPATVKGDPASRANKPQPRIRTDPAGYANQPRTPPPAPPPAPPPRRQSTLSRLRFQLPGRTRSALFERLAKMRERFRTIQKHVFWLRLVDLVVVGSRVEVRDVAVVELASLTLGLDARRRRVEGPPDRNGRLEPIELVDDTEGRAVEWTASIRGLFLILGNDLDGTEVLDNGTFNVGGILRSALLDEEETAETADQPASSGPPPATADKPKTSSTQEDCRERPAVDQNQDKDIRPGPGAPPDPEQSHGQESNGVADDPATGENLRNARGPDDNPQPNTDIPSPVLEQPVRRSGMRDITVAVKLGRLNLPLDSVSTVKDRFRRARQATRPRPTTPDPERDNEAETEAVTTEAEPEEEEAQAGPAGWASLASTVLNAVTDVQFAISSAVVTKTVRTPGLGRGSTTVRVTTKEFGIDVAKLDRHSPLHLTHFLRGETAHQAVVAGMSVLVSLDDAVVVSVPMATVTVRTSVPAKFVALLAGVAIDMVRPPGFEDELKASVVVTSPSVDLAPGLGPQVAAVARALSRRRGRRAGYPTAFRRRRSTWWARLLPQASIRTIIHEAVVRVMLPLATGPPDRFDLLIGKVTSVSVDMSVSSLPMQVSAQGVLRMSVLHLYFQTADGDQHDVVLADLVDVRTSGTSGTSISVGLVGTVQHCSAHLVEGAIGKGIHRVVAELAAGRSGSVPVTPGLMGAGPARDSFLRRLPSWLTYAQIGCVDCTVEVAGLDASVSTTAKGLAVHVERWEVEYWSGRSEETPARLVRRRGSSRLVPDELSRTGFSSPTSPRRGATVALGSTTDGRQAAVTIDRVGVFVIVHAGEGGYDNQPLVSIPRAEMVAETKTDVQGQICAVSVCVSGIVVEYSLFRLYAVCVALSVLRDTFRSQFASPSEPASTGGASEPVGWAEKPRELERTGLMTPLSAPIPGVAALPLTRTGPEVVLARLVVRFVQVRVKSPDSDTPILLVQIRDLDIEKGRWTAASVRARNVRLCVPTPAVPWTWSRVLDIHHLQADFRSETDGGVAVAADRVRIAVPDQVVMYLLIDRMVRHGKVAKELFGRHRPVGWADPGGVPSVSVVTMPHKGPQPPVKVPRLTISAAELLVEVEDNPFEWKIGLIYRQGLAEQVQRLARDAVLTRWLAETRHFDESPQLPRRRSRSATRTQSRDRERPHRDRDRGRDKGRAKTRERTRDRDRDRAGRSRSMPASGGLGDGAFRPDYAPDSWTSKALDRAWVGAKCGDAIFAANRLDSLSWQMRIDRAIAAERVRRPADADEPDDVPAGAAKVLAIPGRPPLAQLVARGIELAVRPPGFGAADRAVRAFMHRVGGLPEHIDCGLVVPIGLQVRINGGITVRMRDYPLPLAIVPGGLEMVGDIVIAEEHRDERSVRWVPVEVVLPEYGTVDGAGRGLTMVFPRVIAPLKSYSQMSVTVAAPGSTRLAWGGSYQAAVQVLMQTVENLSKPPFDLSPRIGFWDKIRLVLHARWDLSWTAGDLQLVLKGSRDPYKVIGDGAGFVFCWQAGVRWRIGWGVLMEIESGMFLLGVPDFGALYLSRLGRDGDGRAGFGIVADDDVSAETVFGKPVMKLTGKVRWRLGFRFDRRLRDGSYTANFDPHHSVVLMNPEQTGPDHDAFKGFRSAAIHMEVGLSAGPSDREDGHDGANRTDPDDGVDPGPSEMGTDGTEVSSYNAVHLSPALLSHFFAWWSLFSGLLSLPVRQGPLWPNPARSSQKFGRHLATVRYRFVFAPVFLSHVYRHEDLQGMVGCEGATGLKVRVDRLAIQLNQGRVPVMATLADQEGANKPPTPKASSTVPPGPPTSPHGRTSRSSHSRGSGAAAAIATEPMKIHRARVDCLSADLRAIESRLYAPDLDPDGLSIGVLSESPGTGNDDPLGFGAGGSHIDDAAWTDPDDFVELDATAVREEPVRMRVRRVLYSPRLTYERDLRLPGGVGVRVESERVEREGPGGLAPPNPRQIQASLIAARIKQVGEHRRRAQRRLGELELRVLRMESDSPDLAAEMARLRDADGRLRATAEFLARLASAFSDGRQGVDTTTEAANDDLDGNGMANRPDLPGLTDFGSSFENRFVVHHAQVRWDNSLRDLIFRYSHQLARRRELVYYSSRRAVKFLLDAVRDQERRREHEKQRERERRREQTGGADDDSIEAEMSLKEALEGTRTAANKKKAEATTTTPRDLAALHAFHIRLIAPQVQLLSDKNKTAAVLVTATNMQLEIVNMMDPARLLDDVSGLIRRHYAATMDGLQIFVTELTRWQQTASARMMSRRRRAGQWPPWVPLETMFDFGGDPAGFAKVVPKTRATLDYDKLNALRAVGRRRPGSQSGQTDKIMISFPPLRATCDSSQYYAVYIIVLDLLLYSEPLGRDEKATLDKIMLASDMSDLSEVPKQVQTLQARLGSLAELRDQFIVRSRAGLADAVMGDSLALDAVDRLGRSGWKALARVDADIARTQKELFFTIKVVTLAQRRTTADDTTVAASASAAGQSGGQSDPNSQVGGLLHWIICADEIEWSLIWGGTRTNSVRTPLVRLRLINTRYDRLEQSDGSNRNSIVVDQVAGWNLLPRAIYRDMITAYSPSSPVTVAAPAADDTSLLLPTFGAGPSAVAPIIRVDWTMLDAVGGISIIRKFEAYVAPLRIQLERDVGKKLFEYIFPSDDAAEAASPDVPTPTDSPTRPDSALDSDSDSDLMYRMRGGQSGRTLGAGRLAKVVPTSTPTSALPSAVPSVTSAESAEPATSQRRGIRALTSFIPRGGTDDVGAASGSASLSLSMSGQSGSVSGMSARPAGSRKKMAAFFGGDRSSSQSAVLGASSVVAGSGPIPASFAMGDTRPRPRRTRTGLSRTTAAAAAAAPPSSSDLGQMLSRAAQYRSLVSAKISVARLCISYRGKAERNVEDVHMLELPLPELRYANKVWSNYDLAVELRKELRKELRNLLLSNAGAILGNKLRRRDDEPGNSAAPASSGKSHSTAVPSIIPSVRSSDVPDDSSLVSAPGPASASSSTQGSAAPSIRSIPSSNVGNGSSTSTGTRGIKSFLAPFMSSFRPNREPSSGSDVRIPPTPPARTTPAASFPGGTVTSNFGPGSTDYASTTITSGQTRPRTSANPHSSFGVLNRKRPTTAGGDVSPSTYPFTTTPNVLTSTLGSTTTPAKNVSIEQTVAEPILPRLAGSHQDVVSPRMRSGTNPGDGFRMVTPITPRANNLSKSAGETGSTSTSAASSVTGPSTINTSAIPRVLSKIPVRSPDGKSTSGGRFSGPSGAGGGTSGENRSN